MNLTRHTTMEKFVTRDVVDSLQLAQLLEQGERVLDVGTGGGVPGVILAIAAARLEGQPVRIDAEKGAGRRGDGRRAGTAGDGLCLPRGGRAGNGDVRHARGPGAGVAHQGAHLVQARIGTRSTSCC